MKIPSLLSAVLIAAACSSDLPPVARDYTVYAGTLPSESGGSERTARVTLNDSGTWQQKDDHIVIELASAPPGRLVFRRSGELMLGREWDRALWGEREPVLHLVR